MDYFNDFLFTGKRALSYVIDKEKSCKSIMKYMLQRLMKMFQYKNLPDSIPRQYLEMYLLVNGQCIIAKAPNQLELYAFTGSVGGEPDPYYRPTKYMVANPALNFSKEFIIDEDCVLIRNDSMWQGLYPLMARYASLLSENFVTLRVADIMLRLIGLITAPDDSSKLSADAFIKKMECGELSAVAENRFLDGIKMQSPPSNNGSYLTQFIELHQYLLGQFYNEIGLNANYNMKREALSESETGLNEDSLLPLVEDMLRCRKEDINKVNKMFGTNIEVEFDSEWKENIVQDNIELERLENEANSNQLERGVENDAGYSNEISNIINDNESESESDNRKSEIESTEKSNTTICNSLQLDTISKRSIQLDTTLMPSLQINIEVGDA